VRRIVHGAVSEGGVLMKRRIAYCVLCIAIASLALHQFVYAAENGEGADFALAKKYFIGGSYDIAVASLETFLKDYPDTLYAYEAHILLGRCYYYRDDYERSIYEFAAVMNSHSEDFLDEALYWTGEVHMRTQDPKKALEFYQKIIDDHPGSRYMPYAAYSRAWALKSLGFMEEALSSFRSVAANYPFEKVAIDSLFRAGECEYLLSRYPQAQNEFQEFTEKFPVSDKTADAYYLKGEAEFYQANYKAAIVSFERALAIAPSAKWAGSALYRKASALFEPGDYKGSIENFKKCVDVSGNKFLSGLALLGIENNYEKLSLVEDAIKACDSIAVSYASGGMERIAAESLYRKTRLLYGVKKYADAMNTAKEAIAKFGSGAYLDRFRYELGWIYLGLGSPDEALGEFTSVQEESVDIDLKAGALSKMGDIYFDKREYRKALNSYETVLNKYSDNFWAGHAQYQVGNVWFSQGNYDRSALAYQSVLVNFPDASPGEDVFLKLGIAYFKTGDFERAAVEFDKLVRLLPGKNADMAIKARLFMGNSLYYCGRYEKALGLFKEVADKSKDEELVQMARYQAAWCYYNIGKEAEAITEFTSYLRDYPGAANIPDVIFWFGEYYGSKKKYDKAKEYYGVIADNYAASGIAEEALYQLADIYYKDGDSDGARARLEELALNFPESVYAKRAYRKIASMRKGAKDYDGAVSSLAKALDAENNEANAQTQYEIAECFENKGDLARASEEYLKVSSLYSKGTFWSVRATLKCAKLFEGMEKFDEARQLYEKLSDMDVAESAFAKQRLELIKWRTAK